MPNCPGTSGPGGPWVTGKELRERKAGLPESEGNEADGEEEDNDGDRRRREEIEKKNEHAREEVPPGDQQTSRMSRPRALSPRHMRASRPAQTHLCTFLPLVLSQHHFSFDLDLQQVSLLGVRQQTRE